MMLLWLLLVTVHAQGEEGPVSTIEGRPSLINVTVSTDAQQPTTNSSSSIPPAESSVITPTPITTPLSNATTLNNGTELVQPELASTEELDDTSQAEERLNDEYGDGNMYESEIDEPVNVTDQPDFAPPPTIDTGANVEPRPTADATRQDASYEEEQSLDPAFMENDMQLDDDAVGVEPTDVNIEDMTGNGSSNFAIFALCLSGFLAGIAFVRWRRQRRSETARYVSTSATFNNPVAFPDMSYNDDPL